MGDKVKLIVPCKPEYVSTVRLTVSSVASKAGFGLEAIEDIKIAVSEACSNIIIHSKLCGKDDYQVVCAIKKDRMEISIKDAGTGFNLEEYREPEQGEISERGLGLFIIKALMDETEVVSKVGKGTKFRMVKRLTVEES